MKDNIYESIKTDIINYHYKPEEPLEEKYLCERYGVSRTPIREVLGRLKQDGWIESNGRKGVCVSKITLKNIKDLFQLRYEVEPMILKFSFAYLSKEKLNKLKNRIIEARDSGDINILLEIDGELHDEILFSSNNDIAIKMIKDILDKMKRFRFMTYTTPEEAKNSANEHIELIDSILDEDLEKSLTILRKHIDSNQLYFIRNINL